jgi:hypothetical protein
MFFNGATPVNSGFLLLIAAQKRLGFSFRSVLAKRTSNPADWKRYRNIKAQTQRELRSAYRKYMNDVISTDLKENPKRFWAAIKSKKQESTVMDGYLLCPLSGIVLVFSFVYTD